MFGTLFLIGAGMLLLGHILAILNMAHGMTNVMNQKTKSFTGIFGRHVFATLLYAVGGFMAGLFGILWLVEKLV